MPYVPVSSEPRRLFEEREAALRTEYEVKERKSRNEYGWLTLMDEEVAEYDDWWDYQDDEDWESSRREYAHEHDGAMKLLGELVQIDPPLVTGEYCFFCDGNAIWEAGRYVRTRHADGCLWVAARKLVGMTD
jgi:hypothetical protein